MPHSTLVPALFRRTTALGLVLVTLASPRSSFPSSASAEDANDLVADRPAADEGWSVNGGLCFTANPDALPLNFEA